MKKRTESTTSRTAQWTCLTRAMFLSTISHPRLSRVGFGAAKMLADKKVDIGIGSQKGEHLEEALRGRGLKYYEMTGAAKEAVALILRREKKQGQ